MWIREILDPTSTQSSKRLAMLIATVSLAVSTIILSIAAVMGKPVAEALAAVSIPLAGLGGYSYVQGSKVQKDPQGE